MKRVIEIERGKAGEPSVPDFLTIEEAADVVRIGRTAAYRLARQYLATDGAIGIPAVRFGKQLRVPRCKIEAALGGPITWPLHEPKTAVELARVAAAPSPAKRAARDPHPRLRGTVLLVAGTRPGRAVFRLVAGVQRAVAPDRRRCCRVGQFIRP